jgi:hypothetical protein
MAVHQWLPPGPPGSPGPTGPTAPNLARQLCRVTTCSCLGYVRSFPHFPCIFITSILVMNTVISLLPLFIASLPVVLLDSFVGLGGYTTVISFFCPQLSHSQLLQTSSVVGGDCICYHSEAFHQPAPNVANHNRQLSPMTPVSHSSIPTFPSFTGPTPPSFGQRLSLPGVPVPSNMSMPILRPFQPFQSQSSSTSEENRRRSMARMSSNRSKRKVQQAVKPCNEPPVPIPMNMDLAVLLFPINVGYFI